MILVLLSLLLISSLVVLSRSLLYRKKLQAQHDDLMVIYRPIADLKEEVSAFNERYSQLQDDYKNKRRKLEEFENLISTYNLGVGTIDAVPYEHLYDTRDISVLEKELETVKEKAKAMVSAKRACLSRLPSGFAINGHKGAAKTFVNREIKLRLRCLDNEVKAAIAIVEWNNINRLVERVKNKFNEINADSQLVKIFLQKDYLELKVIELRLHYEIKQLKADLKEEEREERQRISEEQRDEERTKQELAKTKAARERMEKLVEKELAKINEATGLQREKLALHQKELELLRAKEARAVSLARQTRAGYVYIISNVTSFGEGVCKIGMTRRLDPNDRVKELGDASVPELFTVHAFIYTEDAPALEKYFHDHFQSRRVNLVNRRKEFFYLSPQDALDALDKYSGHYSLEVIK